MTRNSYPLALLLVLLATGCSNIERSRDLANPNVPPAVTAVQVCSNCHGMDGNSVSPNFPRLAGQQPGYVVEQLTNFRSQQRADPAGFEYMWGLSHHLTDDQIKGLADYYAKQIAKPNAPVDAKLMAAGQEIYEKGLPAKEAPPCMACHGSKAEGLANFPRLANQHQDYLIKQLQVFKRTDERPNTPMTQIAHLMSPEEMEAVAGYLQAFPNDK
ncbi:MAG: c-type cytochrome [Sulfuricella sp.]|nr:c-type cytochrome [Sulfuricella sp.]